MPNTPAGIWARIRALMSAREASFTPQPTSGLGFGPRIVGAISMRKNQLQVDGYSAPRFTATTAKDFFEEQYRLLHYMWEMSCEELDREEAEREEFALHALSLETVRKTFGLEADSAGDSIYLSHPDLRPDNIIVDDELHIRGVIDWEFSLTVPRQAFLPTSWITGHDIGSLDSKPDLSSEFMSVLSSRKQHSPTHVLLAQEWDFRGNLRLPMAYILLDPSKVVLLFDRYIFPKLYDEPRDKIVPSVSQRPENTELQAELESRLHASQQYTQYLKDNNLLDDEDDPNWQQIQQIQAWTAETKKKLQQIGEWGEKARDELARWLQNAPCKQDEGGWYKQSTNTQLGAALYKYGTPPTRDCSWPHNIIQCHDRQVGGLTGRARSEKQRP